jgi:hypothetical protein
MLYDKRWMVAVLLTAGLGLPGCAHNSQATLNKRTEAAKVGSMDGTGAKQVTLTREATDRLVIQTVPVQESSVPPRVPGGPNAMRKAVPYAALIYDVDGNAWVYTSPGPLVFVRHRVAVDYVTGELAVLSDGPPAGTAVVTRGAAELYGTELNAGK